MNEETLNQLYLKDTAFQDLMQRRIFNVLLIASPYDAFIMEDDGRVDEQLFFEYVSLSLSSPPRITKARSNEEAMEKLADHSFDMVITMPGVDISETFTGARTIKALHPDLPIVVLTPFSKEVSRRLANEDLSCVDYVFSWLGNVDLLLAIVKLMEDKANADDDINGVGVQMIMLVEDSVRFYSSALPQLYKFLFKQSRNFATEALNEHEQMLRMRGRPKVMLARTYEEAVELYEKFGHNMLGVVSDISFMHGGVKDSDAGVTLAKWMREQDPYLPIILESSDSDNRARVEEMGHRFIDKNSKKFPVDLGDAIMDTFGFGDFIVRDPQTGKELDRIKDLKDMQRKMATFPAGALLRHASGNDISRWLYSRAMFPIAEIVKQHRFVSIEEAPAVRQFFLDLIVKYRKMKNRGVVAVFKKNRFDQYSNFARIGQGSLGGKGRGLAFIDSIIKKNPVCDDFDGISITIPRTVVLCTDVFDEFMTSNNLYPLALSNAPDSEILHHFLQARLPEYLIEDFFALFEVVDKPLAIRSSSLLEDSHYQPFAGIYSTYMIPHVADKYEMLRMLSSAIKSVYASVYFADSKAYMTATSNVIDQEKMAVIIQEVVGKEVDGKYFPSFSGVGRSLNYYPINDETPEDGVAEIAVGLGKYIVDGGAGLRFSPRHPEKVLQTSELDIALRDTQRRMNALDMHSVDDFNVDDGFNLLNLKVQDIAEQGHLKYLVSTYDHLNGVLRDSDNGPGRKVVTFNNVLKHGVFPLAPAVDFMLTKGSQEMCRPVEIEFAGMVEPDAATSDHKGRLYWLQIRPIVDRKELVDDSMLYAPDERVLLRSHTALGHGNVDGVQTVVYVRPENFSASRNDFIAREVAKVNGEMVERGEGYILIGPGRWGSSDTALGIPVKWPHIAGAKLIVESSLPGYRIEPSQGTHFFQNLTSFGVGYFTIDTRLDTGFVDYALLDSMPAVYESENLRIVRFDAPLPIGINGLKGEGVVLKPET